MMFKVYFKKCHVLLLYDIWVKTSIWQVIIWGISCLSSSLLNEGLKKKKYIPLSSESFSFSSSVMCTQLAGT